MNKNISKLVKAKFIILEGKNKKEFFVQFNPPSLSLEQTNEFSEKQLTGLFANQYTGTKKSDLSLELLYDSTSKGNDVRENLKDLDLLVKFDSEVHSPPPCQFKWNEITYDGIVSSYKKEFTFFYADGTPARAKVNLVLKPYVDIEKIAKEADKQSSDISKKRVLIQGDTIFDMAYREYKDISMWRVIAQANNIDDPLNIKYGTELLLPSKDSNE